MMILKPFIVLLVQLVVTSQASLRPRGLPFQTPYRNDEPVIYMNSFYDPRHHDDGRDLNNNAIIQSKGETQLQDSPVIARSSSSSRMPRTYTKEEKLAILEKYKKLQETKLYKRMIAGAADFPGPGDNVAMESSNYLDNHAVESSPVKDSLPVETIIRKIKRKKQQSKAKTSPTQTPVVPAPSAVVLTVKKTEPNNNTPKIEKIPMTKEEHKKTEETQIINTHTHLSQVHFHDHHVPAPAPAPVPVTVEAAAGQQSQVQAQSIQQNQYGHPNDVMDLDTYLSQMKSDLVYGRRKLKGYYLRPHLTPSLGKAFFQVKSQIGYW